MLLFCLKKNSDVVSMLPFLPFVFKMLKTTIFGIEFVVVGLFFITRLPSGEEHVF